MSNKIYVIADLHLDHINIAKLRGFETAEEHDEYLIKQWNSVINKRDTVWVLGDIGLTKKGYHKLDRLKGIKNIVLGNHDKPEFVPELQKYVNKICGSVQLKKCILTHIPIYPTEFYRWEKNIHGHIHSDKIQDDRYVCVSFEHTEMKPVLLNDLI
jgi:calcineurin-like phosphoesterase family protein